MVSLFWESEEQCTLYRYHISLSIHPWRRCKIITNEKTALMRSMLRDSPWDDITREDLGYMGGCNCQQHFRTTALALANSTIIKSGWRCPLWYTYYLCPVQLLVRLKSPDSSIFNFWGSFTLLFIMTTLIKISYQQHNRAPSSPHLD